MKQPAWAAAPNFARCWAASLHPAACREDTDPRNLRLQLARARVITIDPEQVEALPDGRTPDGGPDAYTDLYDRSADLAINGRLPFDTVFFDFGSGVNLEPGTIGGRLIGALAGYWPGGTLQEPVMTNALRELREERGTAERLAPPGIAVIPCLDDEHAKPSFVGAGLTSQYDTIAASLFDYVFRGQLTDQDLSQLAGTVQDATCIVLALNDWLGSFNVDLVEAPLSPRQRAREEKKNRQIAMTVEIKQRRRYKSTSAATGHREYSHRFETRGHYVHHFETKPDGTPNKTFARCKGTRPEKLMEVDGKPCFRFWQPPYVKGPSDRPLVPKVRTG